MSVYVDNAKNKYGRMLMCHMIADTTNELLDMAEIINVSVKWIQNPGEQREHFDICHSKRRLAVEHGAIELSTKELLKIIKLKT